MVVAVPIAPLRMASAASSVSEVVMEVVLRRTCAYWTTTPARRYSRKALKWNDVLHICQCWRCQWHGFQKPACTRKWATQAAANAA